MRYFMDQATKSLATPSRLGTSSGQHLASAKAMAKAAALIVARVDLENDLTDQRCLPDTLRDAANLMDALGHGHVSDTLRQAASQEVGHVTVRMSGDASGFGGYALRPRDVSEQDVHVVALFRVRCVATRRSRNLRLVRARGDEA